MKLKELRGLKYPDDFVIKFFFKKRLHAKRGKAIELGCGNGNNLMLFHQFGWDVTGVDISAQSLADAEFNFQKTQAAPAIPRFIRHDLTCGWPRNIDESFDIILLPNVVNYLLRKQTVRLLQAVRSHANRGAQVFLRSRSVRDYRHRRGKLVGDGSFRMTTDETGEKGLINTCYREFELADMARNHLGVVSESLQVFLVEQENLHGGLTTLNSDIVVWGSIP